ncbi:hypothetical protein A2617_02175 [Candidatus Daviesbacteria bacterium RIFOXYD1_FULL_41_10]|uniref:EfeO-type cupredoxin-like domain-containing protein n=1 Tax=Candidatus Daviesbacteria bacterium RIFOXYD1_FULL_41_10 TaxID=1797801 RepID=A0A1F5MZW5_9BACT|nr:MAG: hypothetical protein A2617_02175 [Candidatus Daviesbacteria bacterium RIFOXYD1_FULL_41_10]
MKNQVIVIGVIVLAIIGAVVYFATRPGREVAPAVTPEPTTVQAPAETFTIAGTPFKFEPNEIKVKKGDRVRITFTNNQGFHDLTIPELNIKTKQLQVGQSDTVEFTADKAGTFEFFCSVPTHKDKGMVGKLIVEDGQDMLPTVTKPAGTTQTNLSPTVEDRQGGGGTFQTIDDKRKGADKPEN